MHIFLFYRYLHIAKSVFDVLHFQSFMEILDIKKLQSSLQDFSTKLLVGSMRIWHASTHTSQVQVAEAHAVKRLKQKHRVWGEDPAWGVCEEGGFVNGALKPKKKRSDAIYNFHRFMFNPNRFECVPHLVRICNLIMCKLY